MIPNFLLTWALVAVSLFNTILLLWLGLTLWLNAERRDLGIGVTAGGFLLGSAFFISHSALLLSDTWSLTRSNTLWLAVGMTPVLLLPFVWYIVLLWYSGYWAEPEHLLRRRHGGWLALAGSILGIGFICLALLGIPYIPVIAALAPFIWPVREAVKFATFGIPVVSLAYPLYVLLCVILSLDVIGGPAAAGRLMGEAARARARPWLIAASLLLIAVGVLVAAVLVWIVTETRMDGYYLITSAALAVIGAFDLVISLLIAAVVLLLGQAMTAYELFTGKALPRQGLARQWRRAILLAAGYGGLMGGALAWGLEPVYAVLLTALLMTVFFALLSWRSYVEWEHAMQQLRPFVASQRWYDALIAGPPGETDAPAPFRALCENLLHTTVAYLLPAGPTATLVGPQSYPPDRSTPALPAAIQPAADAGELIVAVEPAGHGGATWAVPLWRERGLIGALLFGPRCDDRLYTREEIEIARATGERLLDAAASVALSQRLMRLQRERMAATQLLDQRTRRVLHDEVLPLIHTAMLGLAAGQGTDAALAQLADAHGQVSRLLRELPPTALPEIARLGLIAALRKMVEVEFGAAFSGVTWACDEAATVAAARLRPEAAETLYYAARELVRNAAKHARPAGVTGQRPHLEIAAGTDGGQFRLTVADNGRGRFEPSSDAPGAGQGLALHSTLMAIVGGSLALESAAGEMTRGVLSLPVGE
jgi:signal transduction histidine kinase